MEITVRRLLGLLTLCLFLGIAHASDRIAVCAKYETETGWSKGYQVQATVTTGSELNQATSSFDYAPFSKYVVIFWEQHEASVIELDLPYLSAIGQSGKDQRGRRWEVSTGGLCY